MKGKIWQYKEVIVAIVVVLVFLMTCSFAWLIIKKEGDKVNILRAGKLELVLDENATEGIFIEKAVPISNKAGINQQSYSFIVKNNGTRGVNYTLYLDDYEDSDNPIEQSDRIADSSVKYVLTKNSNYTATIKDTIGGYTGTYDLTTNQFTSVLNSAGVEVMDILTNINNIINGENLDADDEAIGAFKSAIDEAGTYEVVKNYMIGNISDLGINPNRVLTTGLIDGKATDTYELRVFIDKMAGMEVMGKTFYTKLRIVAEQAHD